MGGTTPLPLRRQAVHTVFVDAGARQLAELVTLTESGKLSTEASAAYEHLGKGGIRGRLVLVP